jgi:hypothetical protein
MDAVQQLLHGEQFRGRRRGRLSFLRCRAA